MRPYELMYLCPPSLDEERLGAVSERIQQTIATLEVSLPTTQTRELERTIRLTEDILRHLVVRRDE